MNEFIDIPGYPGYKVNRNGECIGPMKWILKPQINNCGYLRARMVLNNKKIHQYIHRLVAIAFITNPNNLPEVDHINNIRTDNRVENLRWITTADNVKRQLKVLNAHYIYPTRNNKLVVRYPIECKIHNKNFKYEDDAQFYVSLLKAIYPQSSFT
tara:strand:+ start:1233 stop:1697 length:465 start_codon:yes stop_codon:yes gene_type:complete